MSFLNRLSVGLGIICLFAVVFSSSAWSGKLYKWVDKNGQTHYSQIPPQKNQVKAKSKVSEKAGASSIPATRKGDYAYCGEMKLPGPLYSPKRILSKLSGRVESWRKSLRSSESSLTKQLRALGDKTRQKNKYPNRSINVSYTDHSGEQRKRTARKIKEYRCAIAWAEKQKNKYSDVKQEMAHDLKGAKSKYQAVLDAAHQDCGFEPKDFSNPNYNQKKLNWKKCMRSHDGKIRTSKRNLTKLRQETNKLD